VILLKQGPAEMSVIPAAAELRMLLYGILNTGRGVPADFIAAIAESAENLDITTDTNTAGFTKPPPGSGLSFAFNRDSLF
jgi:hypothetical protein